MTVLRVDVVNMRRCSTCGAFGLEGTEWTPLYATLPNGKFCLHTDHVNRHHPTVWVRIWPSHRAAFKESQWPWSRSGFTP